MTSQTRELDGTQSGGPAYSFDLFHQNRKWLYDVNYIDRSEGFRTELGYVPRVNMRQAQQSLGRTLGKAVREAYAAVGPAGQSVKNLAHGVWLGHPLHPVLTDVPIGAWTADCCPRCKPFAATNSEVAAMDDRCRAITSPVSARCPELQCPPNEGPDYIPKCVAGRCVVGP